MNYEYQDLLPFVRNSQDETCLKILSEGHTQAEVAEIMGVTKRTIEHRMKCIRDNAALRGWSPEHGMTKVVPNTHVVKGTSTLYDEMGDAKLQWVKSNVALGAQLEAMEHAVEALKESVPRDSLYVPKTYIHRSSDLCNLHVLTDYHIGMLSWGEETGEDWDIKKAEDMIVEWFKNALERAPAATVGVLGQIGDAAHTDGILPVTPASKNVLDTDSRFPLIVRTIIRIMRRVINMMREKYDHVHVINVAGNHDEGGAIWLREMLCTFYEEVEDVTVDPSPDLFYCYEWGNTSLFFHHGHKKKLTNVDDVFVNKFRDVFGRTKYSYAHLGHFHHQASKETNLMLVEQHRTMAAHDAYATTSGYCSGRSAVVVTYSKEYGEVGRLTVTPEMLCVV